MSVIELAKGASVSFISADAAFSENEQLHPDLLTDLAHHGIDTVRVKFFRSLEQFESQELLIDSKPLETAEVIDWLDPINQNFLNQLRKFESYIRAEIERTCPRTVYFSPMDSVKVLELGLPLTVEIDSVVDSEDLPGLDLIWETAELSLGLSSFTKKGPEKIHGVVASAVVEFKIRAEVLRRRPHEIERIRSQPYISMFDEDSLEISLLLISLDTRMVIDTMRGLIGRLSIGDVHIQPAFCGKLAISGAEDAEQFSAWLTISSGRSQEYYLFANDPEVMLQALNILGISMELPSRGETFRKELSWLPVENIELSGFQSIAIE